MAFQESWRVMLNSIAGGAWRERMASFAERCYDLLSPMWSWNVRVPKFWYLGDTLGSGGGVEEAARARVRCDWAKFKELSPILTARDASYCTKGKIYKAFVQSVLTYGTETWAMKKANLQSVEDGTDDGEIRCEGSLNDRKRSVDLYSLLGVHSVADVVRRGRLRWFGHLERIGVWMTGYRPVERWRCQGRDVRGGIGRLKECGWLNWI